MVRPENERHSFSINLNMENLNSATLSLIEAIDLELKNLLLSDLQAVQTQQAA